MADYSSGYWTSRIGGRISRRRLLTSGAAVGAGLTGAALIGCSSGAREPVTPATLKRSDGISPATPVQEKPKRGGTWRLARTNDPPTLDPFGNLSGDTKSVAGTVYSRLFAYEHGPGKPAISFDVIPDAALSMEIPDAATYNVKLNPKVKYTAPLNRPMTSEDVKFSFDRLNGKIPGTAKGPDAGVVESVDQLITPDAATVQFKLKRKYGAFPSVLADSRSGMIMPVETGKTFDPAKTMVGTGPWLFKEYRPGSVATYTRNPDWHLGPDMPYMDGLEQYIIKESATQLTQFLGGNLDTVALEPGGIKRAQEAIKGLQLIENSVGNTRYIVFAKETLATGPVKDVRVRRAMSMALDRDKMLDASYGLPELKALGITPTYHWDTFIPHSHIGYWLDPKAEMSAPNAAAFKLNIAEAMKLMDAAGYKDGFSMDWHWTRGYAGAYQVQGELIPQFLKAIKIDFKTIIDDYASVFIVGTFVGKFQGAALISYTLGETGNFIEAPFTPGLPRNVSGINEPELNTLVTTFQQATTPDDRKKLMKQMQEKATEKMFYVPIPQAPSYTGYQPNVRNAGDYRSQGHASSVQDTPWWWKA
ncbi:MAG: ABC transporter substrate-binding protein [Dehalococcoidia bacterium]|nr:ABC transporter substrate-binding protein [Dehalococcoidia bacterium]